MKTILRNASRATQPVYDIVSGLFTGPGAIGLAFLPLVVGVTTTAFLGFVATETGRAILDEIRRRGRPAAPRPAAPSLRGAPTAAELAADCGTSPRTLAVRLRLGSRLADLEPTLDRGLERKTGRIRGRAPGMKGYIAAARLSVSYRTLMRYKLLANRLRQLLVLDPRLPLEWLLPGTVPDRELPADLQSPYHAARRRLARLLRDHRNFDRLRKHVDAKLGIPELLTVRRAESAARGDYAVTATPDRIGAARRAFARFLCERGLPRKPAACRGPFPAWLLSRG